MKKRTKIKTMKLFGLGIIGLFALVLFTNCESEKTEPISGNEVVETTKMADLDEDSYQVYVKTHKIKSKKAHVFQYKFGEPNQEGFLVYETTYNKNGNILDSIVYKSNKIAFQEKFKYNDDNELIERTLIDSSGKELQRSVRSFNDKKLESGFEIYKNDSLYYKQKREYNAKDELIRLIEFDANDDVKIYSEYSFNDSGDLLAQTELNAQGDILSKVVYKYDDKGNKISIANYNSKGMIQGKTFLKNYIGENAQLIQKYDENDSLYAYYEYEYNANGEEIKNIIYNGIGQIIRQSNTTLDTNGNRILFEIYEGEVGFLGKDEVKFNDKNLEIELTVYDDKNEQVKRKTTSYNEKGLLVKEVNFDKLNEPVYQFTYDYSLFK